MVTMTTGRERERQWNDAIRDEADERARPILQLLAAGMSYAQIGREIGITKQRVGDIVRRARARGLV